MVRSFILVLGFLAGTYAADGAAFPVEAASISKGETKTSGGIMSRQFVSSATVDASMRPDSVTGTETQRNKIFGEKIDGIKVGYFIPMAWDRRAPLSPLLMLGYDMKLEAKRFFINFAVEAVIPTSSYDLGVTSDAGKLNDDSSYYGGLGFDIGGSWFLSDKSISPYIGGGINPRWLWGLGAGSVFSGTCLYADAGIMLFRFSRTRIYAELKVNQNIVSINFPNDAHQEELAHNLTYNVPMAWREVYPTEFGIAMGIGW
ncbi:MAG TPA: hypothetical protein VLX68_15190 [Chitinivibrionales bacterium]|nr:hypothetical protein [Chitinivibrionales bacterium]